MILYQLWRELLGSWWILIALPLLLLLRWLLRSEGSRIRIIRARLLSYQLWDFILPVPTPPHSPAASSGGPDTASTTDPAISDSSAHVESEPVSQPLLDPVRSHRSQIRRRWALEIVESGLVALSLVFFLVRPFVVQAFWIPSQSMEETLQVNDRILVNKFVYWLHPPRRGDIVVFQPPASVARGDDEDWIKRVIGVPGDRIAVHDNHLYVNGRLKQEPYVALLDPSPESDGIGHKHIRTGRYLYSFPGDDLVSAAQARCLKPGANFRVDSTENPSPFDMQYIVQPTADAAPTRSRPSLFFLHDDNKEGLEAVVPPGKLFVMGDNRNNSEDSHIWGCLDENRVLGQAFCIFWPLNRIRVLHGSPTSGSS